MFALFSTAMIGVLGLATDLGFAFAQRRAMQNAADMGAVSGARIVARWSITTPTLAAKPDVDAMASANGMASSVSTVTACNYGTYAGDTAGPCSLPVPATARGVSVTVQETHSTFFMQAVPGTPDSISTSATATAQVQLLKDPPADGPFIICGFDTYLAANGNQRLSILLDNDTVNPAV